MLRSICAACAHFFPKGWNCYTEQWSFTLHYCYVVYLYYFCPSGFMPLFPASLRVYLTVIVQDLTVLLTCLQQNGGFVSAGARLERFGPKLSRPGLVTPQITEASKKANYIRGFIWFYRLSACCLIRWLWTRFRLAFKLYRSWRSKKKLKSLLCCLVWGLPPVWLRYCFSSLTESDYSVYCLVGGERIICISLCEGQLNVTKTTYLYPTL